MSRITASYRASPLLLVTVLTVACSAYLYFSPPVTYGKMAGILRTTEGLTILGWLAFACSMFGTLLASTYSILALVGWPALKTDGETLSINLFPFRRVPITEIDRIVLKRHSVKIYDRSGQSTTINTRLVMEPERFFNETGLLA